MKHSLKSDVQCLADIAAKIRGEYIREDNAWADSPFAWIRTCPSRQVGKIGERLVAGWCVSKGLEVIGCRDSEADLLIEGHRVEVKFSTLWESGVYVFQQIRNQDYEYIICLGVSPFDAHCWVMPKGVALEKASPQHTGRGGEETFWFHVKVDSPPKWMSKYGGSLENAWEVLQKFLRRGCSTSPLAT